MLKYAIIVEMEDGVPAYVQVGERCFGHTSVINPPPEHYQYTASELLDAMKALKRAYPTAFIAAHEIEYIDHNAMIERWGRKYQEIRKGWAEQQEKEAGDRSAEH
jgi:hypothetical protein